MAIKEKDIHKLKEVFKGFEDQGSPFATQLFFSCCPCRKDDIKNTLIILTFFFFYQPML